VERNYEALRQSLLEEARTKGLEGAARFDWLVDRALALPTHTVATASPEAGGPGLRPEFQRLFVKFRIGKTHYTYKDPATGARAEAPVLRCDDCHSSGVGTESETERVFVERMRQLTTATARAERMLIAARRGGVEVREVAPHVDAAVAAQIELEVLVHTFSSAPDGPFLAKYADGVAHAESALTGARRALEELAARRRGLFVFLGVLGLALVGLVLKIRTLPRDE
jgi:hypothetical protein